MVIIKLVNILCCHDAYQSCNERSSSNSLIILGFINTIYYMLELEGTRFTYMVPELELKMKSLRKRTWTFLAVREVRRSDRNFGHHGIRRAPTVSGYVQGDSRHVLEGENGR